MIGYVTLGTNDLDRAAAFYDALFAEIGGTRHMEEAGRYVAWGVSPTAPGIGITVPFDGNKATVGNGTMVALIVDAPDKVDRLHAKALALGGKDEGAPGQRFPGFYAAYFRDLDGNKFNAFYGGEC